VSCLEAEPIGEIGVREREPLVGIWEPVLVFGEILELKPLDMVGAWVIAANSESLLG
jgi:hypothetical protein